MPSIWWLYANELLAPLHRHVAVESLGGWSRDAVKMTHISHIINHNFWKYCLRVLFREVHSFNSSWHKFAIWKHGALSRTKRLATDLRTRLRQHTCTTNGQISYLGIVSEALIFCAMKPLSSQLNPDSIRFITALGSVWLIMVKQGEVNLQTSTPGSSRSRIASGGGGAGCIKGAATATKSSIALTSCNRSADVHIAKVSLVKERGSLINEAFSTSCVYASSTFRPSVPSIHGIIYYFFNCVQQGLSLDRPAMWSTPNWNFRINGPKSVR